MKHYIVLVKQVPDVSQITDNAFDPKTGNLIRTRLASVINELDAQALAFAWRMKQLSGEEGKVIALTMGPPMAAEVLRYSLCRCADQAVLLTDRALGGADTWATANPLAYAVRKMVPELLGGSEEYFIVAGMQSVDGDTAQVPAQLAEELNLPCIAYVTDAAYEHGDFAFTRIISGGSQVVRPKRVPAVLTVAKYEYPLYASFSKTRAANQFELLQWSAADIAATHVGVKGSKTRVIRVFPPGKTTRKCEQVSDPAQFAKIILDKAGSTNGEAARGEEAQSRYVLPSRRANVFDRSFEGTEKEVQDFEKLYEELRFLDLTDLDKIDEQAKGRILASKDIKFHEKALDDMIAGYRNVDPTYTGQVWVMAEHDGGKINSATFELIGKASDLAKSLDTKVGVCIAGSSVRHLAEELIAGGADDVYVIEHPLLENFDPYSYRKAVSDCIEKYKPQIVLYGATPQGRVLAPMVSYRVGCGLTADCTGLDIRDTSRKGQIATLFQTRPALGGNIMATIVTKDSTCQMATARPGVMKRLDPDSSRQGNVIDHAVEITEADLSMDILSTEKGQGNVNFEADVIVAGGKGMQNRDVFETMTSQLCSAIAQKADTIVEKGATRAAVEQGFVERIHQVGQTGTAVGPKLYIALGISGAIQHMIGVANSETIVAINSDPEAPIFRQCDYYYVGTIESIVPELIKQMSAG